MSWIYCCISVYNYIKPNFYCTSLYLFSKKIKILYYWYIIDIFMYSYDMKLNILLINNNYFNN